MMSDKKIDVFNLNVHSIDLNGIIAKMQKSFEKGITFEDVVYDEDFKLKLVMLDYESKKGRVEKEKDTLVFITTLSEVKDILEQAKNASAVIKEYTDTSGTTVLKILS